MAFLKNWPPKNKYIMELDELNSLTELNELDLLYKLIEIAQSNKVDAEKVLKGEKKPGARVRKSMQDIRLLCEVIRDKIQIRIGKDKNWKEDKIPALDRIIKKAEESSIKENKMIEKNKMERIERLIRYNQQQNEE